MQRRNFLASIAGFFAAAGVPTILTKPKIEILPGMIPVSGGGTGATTLRFWGENGTWEEPIVLDSVVDEAQSVGHLESFPIYIFAATYTVPPLRDPGALLTFYANQDMVSVMTANEADKKLLRQWQRETELLQTHYERAGQFSEKSRREIPTLRPRSRQVNATQVKYARPTPHGQWW